MATRVLGIGGSNHDFSACVVEDGVLKVAIEDERVQRVKHGKNDWHSKPGLDATTYCLDTLGLKLDDIDLIVVNDDLERPSKWLDWESTTMINHHTAHAAAAFFAGGCDAAALMVVDGHGSALAETKTAWNVETISIGEASATDFSIGALQTGHQKRTSSSWRYVTNHSIGWLYEIVGQAIGFGSAGQGKTMGLAAYGIDRFEDRLRSFVEIGADGSFRFDPYDGIWDWLSDCITNADNALQVRADLAAAAQTVFGDAIVAVARQAHRRTGQTALAYGGGCSLNTVANSRILDETDFESVHVFPAAGDNGLAVGAALYGYHVTLGNERPARSAGWRGRAVYLGREYDDCEIRDAIACRSVSSSEPKNLSHEVARHLVAGDVVAMFQGGSEIGPRALGHRSFLASPHTSRMRDHMNLNVKHRESFRPLAPVVPIEHAGEFFDGPLESPYMLFVSIVRPEYRTRLAAVTHIDGTARIQTVRREDNPFLHELLLQVGELDGMPVLLNTSLNLPGVPIVETPLNALDLFLQRPVDLLVIGNHVVRKFTPWADTRVPT